MAAGCDRLCLELSKWALVRHKQKLSQLADRARPLLSFTLSPTVMFPETEKSSCLSDHKPGSRGGNCFPTEKEWVQAKPPAQTPGRSEMCGGPAWQSRRGEWGQTHPKTRLHRVGSAWRFPSRMSTHKPDPISGYSDNNSARKMNNQPRQRERGRGEISHL